MSAPRASGCHASIAQRSAPRGKAIVIYWRNKFAPIFLDPDKEDSPHLDAEKISGEMYFGCAEIDEHAPQEMIDNLEAYLSKTDVNYRIEIYPNTDHGFVFPDRIAKYSRNAAETHWSRILSLFQRNLKPYV